MRALLLAMLALVASPAAAVPVTYGFTAVVHEVFSLDVPIVAGDAVHGRFIYDSDAIGTSHSPSEGQSATYEFSGPPFGLSIRVKNYSYRWDHFSIYSWNDAPYPSGQGTPCGNDPETISDGFAIFTENPQFVALVFGNCSGQAYDSAALHPPPSLLNPRFDYSEGPVLSFSQDAFPEGAIVHTPDLGEFEISVLRFFAIRVPEPSTFSLLALGLLGLLVVVRSRADA